MKIFNFFSKLDLFNFTVSCVWVPRCVWEAGYMSFVWMNSFFNKSTLRDYAIVLKVKFLSMSMQDQWWLEISLLISNDHRSCIDIDKNFTFNRPDNGSQLLYSILSGCNSLLNLVQWFQNCAMLKLRVKENEFWFIIGWESY